MNMFAFCDKLDQGQSCVLGLRRTGKSKDGFEVCRMPHVGQPRFDAGTGSCVPLIVGAVTFLKVDRRLRRSVQSTMEKLVLNLSWIFSVQVGIP
jgi:hypothetical protein